MFVYMFLREHVDIFNNTLIGYFINFQNVIGYEYFINRDIATMKEVCNCIRKT